MPRKTLGWKTPAEAFDEHLLLLKQVGVPVPAADGTEERFVQWSDVVQSADSWTVQHIEASVEDPAIQCKREARGFQPGESLSQYSILVNVSQQRSGSHRLPLKVTGLCPGETASCRRDLSSAR